MDIKKALQRIGLTEKESALYISTLEVGSGSVQTIARKAGIVRSTAYETLQSLREKGYVSTFLKKRSRHYSAEDPTAAVRIAYTRARVLEEALPQLRALVGNGRRRPNVRYYEGIEGITSIIDEMLNEANEIMGFGSADDAFQKIESFSDFVQRRVAQKIPIRLIMPETAKARQRKSVGIKELRAVRFVSERYPFHGIIYVWKNKIAHIALSGDFTAVVIESKELADMQRSMLCSLWDQLVD